MATEYLSLVKVTLRDIDDKTYLGEGDVLVLTDTNDKQEITVAAIKEFDHANPMVSGMQTSVFHVADIRHTVELPRVISDMKPDTAEELVDLVRACEGHEDILDGLVHDVYDKKAADVNNNGLDLQIEELIQELGPQGLGEELRDRLNEVED
jgi:hypothetical protein